MRFLCYTYNIFKMKNEIKKQQRPKTTQKFKTSIHASFKPQLVGINNQTNEPYYLSQFSSTGMRPLYQVERIQWQKYNKKKAQQQQAKIELLKSNDPNSPQKNKQRKIQLPIDNNPKKKSKQEKPLVKHKMHYLYQKDFQHQDIGMKIQNKKIAIRETNETNKNNENSDKRLQSTSKSLQNMFEQYRRQIQQNKIQIKPQIKSQIDQQKLIDIRFPQKFYKQQKVRPNNNKNKQQSQALSLQNQSKLILLLEKQRNITQTLMKQNNSLKHQLAKRQFQLMMQYQNNKYNINIQDTIRITLKQQLKNVILQNQINNIKKQNQNGIININNINNIKQNNQLKEQNQKFKQIIKNIQKQKQILVQEKQKNIKKYKQIQQMLIKYTNKIGQLQKIIKQNKQQYQNRIFNLQKIIKNQSQQNIKIQKYKISTDKIKFISKLIINHDLNDFLTSNIQKVMNKKIKTSQLIFKKDQFHLNISNYIDKPPFPLVIVMKAEDNHIFGAFSQGIVTDNVKGEKQFVNFLFNADQKIIFQKNGPSQKNKINGLSFFENYLRFGNNELCMKNYFISEIKILMGSTFGYKYYNIFNKKDLIGSNSQILKLKDFQMHEVIFQ